MNKEMNNIEEIEAMNEEKVMETETKQGALSKIGGWCKKHGKKVVTGVAVIGVGLLGYALGQKSVCEDDEYDYEDAVELDFIEDDSVEVDSE